MFKSDKTVFKGTTLRNSGDKSLNKLSCLHQSYAVSYFVKRYYDQSQLAVVVAWQLEGFRLNVVPRIPLSSLRVTDVPDLKSAEVSCCYC